MTKKQTLIICSNQGGILSTKNNYILLWESYSNDINVISILDYIENNKEKLRTLYLRYISSIKEKKYLNTKIDDYFKLDGDFSFWSQTLIHEKSPYKTDSVFKALKLIALEIIVDDLKIKKIILDINDDDSCFVIRKFCKDKNIFFKNINKKRHPNISVKNSTLCNLLMGIIYISRIAIKIKKNHIEKSFNENGGKSAIFFSFLCHVDKKYEGSGLFRSGLWSNLPDLVRSQGYKISWLHNLSSNSALGSVGDQEKLIHSFNKRLADLGAHNILDLHVSLDIFKKIFFLYIRSVLIYFKINIKKSTVFELSQKKMNLWKIYESDWRKSLIGRVALDNYYYYSHYKYFLASIPFQDIGLYPFENQPWEYSLIHFWRKNSHGKIIGYQHSTTPFWHLYQFNEEGYIKKNKNTPDFVAVNNKYSYTEFIRNRYATSKIFKVEAIRYNTNNLIINDKPKFNNSILILGSTIKEEMDYVLKFISRSGKVFNKYAIKFHPEYKIKDVDSILPGIEILGEDYLKDLHRYTLVIVPSGTSAAIDVLIRGIVPIVVVYPGNLNLSPLLGYRDEVFVKRSEDFTNFVSDNHLTCEYGCQDYFYHSEQYERWRSLIGK